MRRKVACWVGCVRISRKREGLATATAEIDFLSGTGAARLLHPVKAPEPIEGRTVVPDRAERLLLHIVEGQRKSFRSVAGQHLALGLDGDDVLRPAAHARLRELCVIVGRHVVDIQHAFQPVLRLADDGSFLKDPFVIGQKRGPISGCPAVILHMGDLEPVGFEFKGEVDQRARLPDIMPVRRRVEGQGQARFPNPARDAELLLQALFVISDLVGDLRVHTLQAELDMIEATICQLLDALRRQRHPSRYQVRINPAQGERADKIFKILPQRRLAARQVNLQNAKIRSLRKRGEPRLRVEFVRRLEELDRV